MARITYPELFTVTDWKLKAKQFNLTGTGVSEDLRKLQQAHTELVESFSSYHEAAMAREGSDTRAELPDRKKKFEHEVSGVVAQAKTAVGNFGKLIPKVKKGPITSQVVNDYHESMTTYWKLIAKLPQMDMETPNPTKAIDDKLKAIKFKKPS